MANIYPYNLVYILDFLHDGILQRSLPNNDGILPPSDQ